MDKRIVYGLAGVVVLVGLFFAFYTNEGGGGFLQGGYNGIIERVSYNPSTTSKSVLAYLEVPKYSPSYSWDIQGNDPDEFVDKICMANKKEKCADCERECDCKNDCWGGYDDDTDQCTGTHTSTCYYSTSAHKVDCDHRCENTCDSGDWKDSCSDDSMTDYSKAGLPVRTTYFGLLYDCIQMPSSQLAALSFGLDKDKNDKNKWVRGVGTVSQVSIEWKGKGGFSWSYPCIPSGDVSTWGSGNTPLLDGNKFVGIKYNTCTLAGWDATSIAYVASDPDNVSSIKKLEDSGYFTTIKTLGSIPANASQIEACKASCPQVTTRVNPRNSKSTREAQARRRAAEEKARTACLNTCPSIVSYQWTEDGVAKQSITFPYSSQKMATANDTMYLFKDATARIYSGTQDFAFLADMRGGVSNTLLCARFVPTCNNSVCETGESCSNCPADCGACPIICGDAICNGDENCLTCSDDCGCSDATVCDPARAVETNESRGCIALLEATLTKVCSGSGYVYTNTTCPAGTRPHNFVIGTQGLTLEATAKGMCCEPIVCASEARLCPDNTPMPRDANCTWELDKCPPVVTVLPNGTTVKQNASEISYCGDGTCDATKENCTSCNKDCNKCVACTTTLDCYSSIKFGVADSGTGVWSCQKNTCVWNEAVSAGGGGIEDDYMTYIMIAVGALLAILVIFKYGTHMPGMRKRIGI